MTLEFTLMCKVGGSHSQSRDNVDIYHLKCYGPYFNKH